jgi:hypothetical protein
MSYGLINVDIIVITIFAVSHQYKYTVILVRLDTKNIIQCPTDLLMSILSLLLYLP